jgi:hypothetical protein
MSSSTTDLSLDERIAAAFGDDITSDEVVALIKEARDGAQSQKEVAQQARTRALDPALSIGEVAEARRQDIDATFAHERLSAAVPELQQRLKELAAEKENARRWLAYQRAETERDRLAEELARTYPPIAEQLAELIGRMAANDRQLDVINDYKRPSGADRRGRARPPRLRSRSRTYSTAHEGHAPAGVRVLGVLARLCVAAIAIGPSARR